MIFDLNERGSYGSRGFFDLIQSYVFHQIVICKYINIYWNDYNGLTFSIVTCELMKYFNCFREKEWVILNFFPDTPPQSKKKVN